MKFVLYFSAIGKRKFFPVQASLPEHKRRGETAAPLKIQVRLQRPIQCLAAPFARLNGRAARRWFSPRGD
jgi:hypothetical protein